jgi:hypothetical protein
MNLHGDQCTDIAFWVGCFRFCTVLHKSYPSKLVTAWLCVFTGFCLQQKNVPVMQNSSIAQPVALADIAAPTSSSQDNRVINYKQETAPPRSAAALGGWGNLGFILPALGAAVTIAWG